MTKDKKFMKALNVDPNAIIDDSKMPTPEQVKNFPETPEIDKALDIAIDAIGKKYDL